MTPVAVARCRHDPPQPATCKTCHVFANPGGVAFALTPARPDRPPALPLLPSCHWEGEVLEWCNTCTGPAAEIRHVRRCLFEGWDVDRCTRAAPNSALQRCDRCPHYTPAGDPGG